MRLFAFISCLIISFSNLNAQGILDDPDAVFISPEGNTLSREEAADMLYSSQRYRLEKDATKIPGKLLVTLVPISEKEFQKIIADQQKSVKGLKGSKMVDYELPDLEGNLVKHEELIGKIVVYNFWFTGCRPCIEELPQLNELADKHGSDVLFIAPTFNNQKQVEKWLSKREFKYKILVDGTELSKQLGITSYPTHLVVDPEGVIRKVFIGANESIGKKLDSAINSL